MNIEDNALSREKSRLAFTFGTKNQPWICRELCSMSLKILLFCMYCKLKHSIQTLWEWKTQCSLFYPPCLILRESLMADSSSWCTNSVLLFTGTLEYPDRNAGTNQRSGTFVLNCQISVDNTDTDLWVSSITFFTHGARLCISSHILVL